jgi:hypothetical protein
VPNGDRHVSCSTASRARDRPVNPRSRKARCASDPRERRIGTTRSTGPHLADIFFADRSELTKIIAFKLKLSGLEVHVLANDRLAPPATRHVLVHFDGPCGRCERDGRGDHIPELPNVAGPVVTREAVMRDLGKTTCDIALPKLCRDVLDQDWDVLFPFTERGNLDFDLIEPEKEITSKRRVVDLAPSPAVWRQRRAR